MQSSDKDKKNAAQPETELSATWQALLGQQASGEAKTPKVDLATPAQPLSSDPWSSLRNAQGMQPVDLQKVHLPNLRASANDDHDIEDALSIMREATGQLPKVEAADQAPTVKEKTKDA
ncbi:MAG: hypothetical protein ACRDHZ_20125 [Ktedonobacteraceae bacterium]